MNYLCINTCFKSAYISLFGDKEDFLCLDSNCKHSEQVLPAINRVLSNNGLKIEDLTGVGVCVGPGSFTGIRIGVALVKGLMFASDIPCFEMCSLELIACEYFLRNKNKNNVIAIMNGLSDKYFIAKYSNELKCEIEPKMIDKNELRDLIIGGKCEFICESEDKEAFDMEGVKISFDSYKKLIENKIILKEAKKSEDITPLYLRLSQAEVELLKKDNGNQ